MENDLTEEAAKTALDNKKNNSTKMIIVWTSALILGGILGSLGIKPLNEIFEFIATVFTRLFQFIAIPTISLAVITTLSQLGAKKSAGRIFAHTVKYTLLTTFAAAGVALLLYYFFTPGNLPVNLIAVNSEAQNVVTGSYYEHLISIIPNNIIQPLVSNNVLSVIIVSVAIGLGLAFTKDGENKTAFVKTLFGFQEVLFTIIKGIIKVLPLGIAAFTAQLFAQIEGGGAIGALSKYCAIVLGGNLLQIFAVIPLFLLFKGLNPINVFKKMSKALIVAFFTKSSAGTLPVTLSCAENNLNVKPEVSRFVLPICTTVNMNGCAAFILITSLFVMQNSGFSLTPVTMITWLFISVFAAIGNAGVPMGCYFLTLSLMSSAGANLGILGVILPIYTVIDMVETVENVWSDSAVCAMTDKDMN